MGNDMRMRGPFVLWEDEDKTRAYDMRRAGMSGGQIAALMGRTRNAVLGLLHRAGIVCRHATTGRRPSVAPVKFSQLAPSVRVPGERFERQPLTTPEPPAEITPLNIPLRDTKRRECRFGMWPHDKSGAPDYPMCGLRTEPLKSFCPTHQRMAYMVGTAMSAKRAQDLGGEPDQ